MLSTHEEDVASESAEGVEAAQHPIAPNQDGSQSPKKAGLGALLQRQRNKPGYRERAIGVDNVKPRASYRCADVTNTQQVDVEVSFWCNLPGDRDIAVAAAKE